MVQILWTYLERVMSYRADKLGDGRADRQTDGRTDRRRQQQYPKAQIALG